MVRLRRIQLAEVLLPCHVLGGVGDGFDRMIALIIIVSQKVVDFAQVHGDAEFSIGFANMGEEYLLYGNVVMMPHSCINASSTSRSPLRLVGVGKLCA